MGNLKISFVDEQSTGDIYKLVCKNDSTAPWVFYVYQKMPQQPSQVFSLAWFASPFVLVPGAHITFEWTIDYSFVWAQTGAVTPGVSFSAGQTIPASLTGNNQTTFSVNPGPHVSPAIPGGQAGSLTVNQASDVPNLQFSTGIGMSGQGAFVQQALQNAPQVYTPTPKYFIAAGTQVQMGQVLAQTVTQSAEVTFPINVFTLYATLGQNNKWAVASNPSVKEAQLDGVEG